MSNSAFEALAGLATICRKSARGLPGQMSSAPRWSGVGFSLLGKKFVSPMGHVTELMEVPSSTRLPGVHPWVIGLSNVRGRLLPLFDLSLFLGGAMSAHRKHHRVLVLETETLYSGIVVDTSFGMQHFTVDQYSENAVDLSDQVNIFIEGAYRDSSGEPWPVFSLARLAEDARFINAAII